MAWEWPFPSNLNTMMNRLLLAAGSAVQAQFSNSSDITGVLPVPDYSVLAGDIITVITTTRRGIACPLLNPDATRISGDAGNYSFTFEPSAPVVDRVFTPDANIYPPSPVDAINLSGLSLGRASNVLEFQINGGAFTTLALSEGIAGAPSSGTEFFAVENSSDLILAQNASGWMEKFSAAGKAVLSEIDTLEAKKDSLWDDPKRNTVRKMNSIAAALNAVSKRTGALLGVYADYFAQEKDPRSSEGQAVRKSLVGVKKLSYVIALQSRASREISDSLKGKRPLWPFVPHPLSKWAFIQDTCSFHAWASKAVCHFGDRSLNCCPLDSWRWCKEPPASRP